MSEKAAIRYDYIQGNDGKLYPYVGYIIHSMSNAVLFSRPIFVPNGMCKLSTGLTEVCKKADDFVTVTKMMECKIKEFC